MGNEVITYDSVEKHVTALISKEYSDLDSKILLERIRSVTTANKKIASMPAEVIARALLVAMAPDKTLVNHMDIYFIPRGNEINVSFSHNFLQKLALKTGVITLFNIHLIYDGDTVLISENGLKYNIDPFREKNTMENFKGVLVEAIFSNGTKKYGHVTKEHINKARAASKNSGGGPWAIWYYEMAKKVGLKNFVKSIELSVEFAEAIRIDNMEYVEGKPPEIESVQKEEKSDSEKAMDNILNVKKKDSISRGFLNSLEIDFEEKKGWASIDIKYEESFSKYEIFKKDTILDKFFIKIKDDEPLEGEIV